MALSSLPVALLLRTLRAAYPEARADVVLRRPDGATREVKGALRFGASKAQGADLASSVAATYFLPRLIENDASPLDLLIDGETELLVNAVEPRIGGILVRCGHGAAP